MKQPLFRHLDENVEIFGFRPEELIIIASCIVLFSELSRYLEISRAWGVGLTVGVSLLYRTARKAYGPNSFLRLLRFISLPDGLKESRIRVRIQSK